MNILKRTLIFTATYNESENIEKLIRSIKKQPFNLDILIIDDNSPDGTKNIITSLQKDYINLFLINREYKLGLDTAHKVAYNYAISNKYDFLITMDADLSHDPNEIKNFLVQLECYPFVIGSRYMEGGKCLMKNKRLIISKYGNLLMKYLLRIDCNEFTTSYRGFNIKKLKNFNLDMVKTKGYSFFMGTICEIVKKNYTVKEIPIIFKDRSKGYSKIPRLEIFRTLKNLFILSIKNLFIKP
jgi:dolichol-phosphate mannosyltransferase